MKLTRKKEFILLAIGIAVLTTVFLLNRPHWTESLPPEIQMPQVVPDDTPVSFPEINTWQAPINIVERGYYYRDGYIDMRIKEESAGEERDTSVVYLTEQDYRDLLELMNMPDAEVKQLLNQPDSDFDFWPLRIQVAVQEKVPENASIFWEFLSLLKYARPNEKWPDDARDIIGKDLGYLGDIPSPPVEGMQIHIGYEKQTLCKIIRKETISHSGAVFKCWRIELSVEQPELKIKQVSWAAPGVGTIYTISSCDMTGMGPQPEGWKKYLPHNKKIYLGRSRLKEVMIPSKNFYWKAQDESPAK